MPTLEELKQWMRGEKPDAIQPQSRYEPTAPPDPYEQTLAPKQFKGGKYKISSNGDDALLLFGKHHGRAIKDLSEDPMTIGYLQWILSQEFPEDLKDVIRFRLGMRKR